MTEALRRTDPAGYYGWATRSRKSVSGKIKKITLRYLHF